MNKAYFTELAAYNQWATDITCSWLAGISDEQWNQPVISSFGSIQQTVLHVISAENAWAERLMHKESVAWLQKEFTGSKAAHIALWKKVSGMFPVIIRSFDETRLSEPLTFKRFNGETHTALYYQVFAHAFNHSGYHRGQLVTLLRQAGFTDLQSTDLTTFYGAQQQHIK
ncbi:MAG TPA: DinB family protein [Niabella sp.]